MFATGELADIYKTDFLLAKDHNLTLSEINDMIPFERQIYISIVLDYLEKKKKALKQF
jgi:hypothetical protein